MDSFTLLSLNTFGVPFYLSSGRIKRLAAEINRLKPTVACLQEIQQNAYLPLLQRGLAAYPSGHLLSQCISPEGRVVHCFRNFNREGRFLSLQESGQAGEHRVFGLGAQ